MQAQGVRERQAWYQSVLRGLRGVAAAIGAQPGEQYRLDLLSGMNPHSNESVVLETR